MTRIFYDKDADLAVLKNKTIGIIGYGIQGRAQALNFRDAGLNVIVANRQDDYHHRAVQDGFTVLSIDALVKQSDVILFLIPDQAQKNVYKEYIKNNLRPNAMLVFAHGYVLRYKTVELSHTIDVAMLAPRMPGHQIRHYFLKDHGVPAFIDVIQNPSGLAWQKLLALSKAGGFTRAGVLEVSYKVETELDLFIEQFLVPNIIKSIHMSFQTLVNEFDFPPIPTLMELYASGELAEVLKMAAKEGIGKAFQNNASPTCQFGIASNFKNSLEEDPTQRIKKIMQNITDGSFKDALEKEGNSNYSSVQKLWKSINSEALTKTQQWINESFKQKEI